MKSIVSKIENERGGTEEDITSHVEEFFRNLYIDDRP